jgi:hypothetical protein
MYSFQWGMENYQIEESQGRYQYPEPDFGSNQ